MTKIRTFAARRDAIAAQDAAFAALAARLGLPVDGGGIVGRNAATGQPDYAAARTVRWAEIETAPTGELWFESPGVEVPGTDVDLPVKWREEVETKNG